MSWSVNGISIPRPESLVPFDHQKKEINSSVVVIGSSAVDFLRHLHQTASGLRTIDASVPGTASFNYLTLQLGAIRGFATCFHLYAFGDDERLESMITEIVPHASALIIAAERDSANVRTAARLAASLSRKPAVAVLAPEATRREWARLAPAFEATMSTESVFPALKSVAKQILTRLKNEGSPQPSAKSRPWWKFW